MILFYWNIPGTIYLNKKYFLLILILSISFSAVKNIHRISNDNFINSPLDKVKRAGWHSESEAMNLNGFNYYSAWGNAPVSNSLDSNKYGYKKKFTYNIIFKK